ncbi:prostatic acid phosphatase-like protein [Leptotrombidium deliense]|uniref:Prostatic acid phosphatase-like protein n=1 Tax=Leptotrombidium deliense TaxID=299467 RepID=A0A443S2E6_9ACAR|nr:prostatic acid phosphatase-like protein [Leptotrombidium deliense]
MTLIFQEGKNRMYSVGSFMRKRYVHFMTNNTQELLIKSLNLDRCLVSAELVAAGMYPPSGKFVWNKNVNWQPFAIHLISPQVATMGVACPDDKEKIETLVQNDKCSLKICNKLLNYFTAKNYTNLNCSNLYYISSAFSKIQNAGYQLPNIINEQIFEYLKEYESQETKLCGKNFKFFPKSI